MPAETGPNDTRIPARPRNRKSEPERSYFRCERYFTVGHEWYATVREGRDMGPYSNRIEAELAVARLVVRRLIASPARATAIDDRPGKPGTTRFEVVLEELVAWHYARQLRTEISAYVWTKQRLEGLRKDPSKHDHWPVRVHVLEQLLSELDK